MFNPFLFFAFFLTGASIIIFEKCLFYISLSYYNKCNILLIYISYYISEMWFCTESWKLMTYLSNINWSIDHLFFPIIFSQVSRNCLDLEAKFHTSNFPSLYEDYSKFSMLPKRHAVGGNVPMFETDSTSSSLIEELWDPPNNGERIFSDPRSPSAHSYV